MVVAAVEVLPLWGWEAPELLGKVFAAATQAQTEVVLAAAAQVPPVLILQIQLLLCPRMAMLEARGQRPIAFLALLHNTLVVAVLVVPQIHSEQLFLAVLAVLAAAGLAEVPGIM